MKEIINKYGTFQHFVDYYQLSLNEVKLNRFKRVLQQNFQFLGGITVYHFLTDIELNVIKPDRVIMRIFTRLDLVKSNKDFNKAIEIGRLMSSQTGYPIRFIDLILVLYGRLNHPGIVSICTDSNPKCHLLSAKKRMPVLYN